MRGFLEYMMRLGIALPLSSITWFIAIFFIDLPFLLAGLAGLVGGVIPYYLVKWRQYRNMLKRFGLSSQEFKYILQNMKEAREKVNRIQGNMFQLRSASSMRQLHDISKLSRRIYSIVKKNPQKFYTAERFFFYHLDSAVEMLDKYTILTTQPVKNKEVLVSLEDTRKTLFELTSVLEEELMKVLSTDLSSLKIELDLAKRSFLEGPSERSKEGM